MSDPPPTSGGAWRAQDHSAYACIYSSSNELRPGLRIPPVIPSGTVSNASCALRSLQEASKSGQEHFISALRASKSVPRGSQEAFPAPSTSMQRLGPRFGPVFAPQRRSRDHKKQRILSDVLQVLCFCPFQLESPPGPNLGPSRAPFWEPFGPQDGRNLPWKSSWSGQEPIKRTFFRSQSRPRGLQDRSKS